VLGLEIEKDRCWDWPLAELAALPRTLRPRSLNLCLTAQSSRLYQCSNSRIIWYFS